MDSVRNSIMDYGLLKFSWDSYRYLSIIPSFITPGYSSGIPPAIPPGLSPGFPRICFRNSCTKSSKITSYLIDHSRDASWGFSYDSFADYFMEYSRNYIADFSCIFLGFLPHSIRDSGVLSGIPTGISSRNSIIYFSWVSFRHSSSDSGTRSRTKVLPSYFPSIISPGIHSLILLGVPCDSFKDFYSILSWSFPEISLVVSSLTLPGFV